jgi:hypothetical protein
LQQKLKALEGWMPALKDARTIGNTGIQVTSGPSSPEEVPPPPTTTAFSSGLFGSGSRGLTSSYTEGADVPSTKNVASVFREQMFSYVRLTALNILCPTGGSGPMVLRSLSKGAARGAVAGAIKGAVRGAAVGTFFDGVGALPGAALGGAAGAANSLVISTARAKTCEALGVNGY